MLLKFKQRTESRPWLLAPTVPSVSLARFSPKRAKLMGSAGFHFGPFWISLDMDISYIES